MVTCNDFFQFFFQILECEELQIVCPLVNFHTLEMFLFFLFLMLYLKKERKLGGKLLDKKGPPYQGNVLFYNSFSTIAGRFHLRRSAIYTLFLDWFRLVDLVVPYYRRVLGAR